MKLGTQFNPLPQANIETAKRDKALEKIGAAVALGMEESASRTISDMFQSQISSASQGIMNANDAISMMQIAGGTINSLSAQSQSLNDMSIRYNSATLDPSQKEVLEKEFNQTVDTMRQSINNATYNGNSLFGSSMSFSLGEESLSTSIGELSASSISIESQESIQAYQDSLAQAASEIGSTTNTLFSATNSLLEQITSASAAKSQLSDTDMASEIKNFHQNNITLDMSQIAQVHQNDLLRQNVERLLG